MKKVKYRYYMDYEKEEQWVNDMALQGWHLKQFKFIRFTFVKGEPGAYIYRNELLKGLASKEEYDYMEFLKESGIEVINKSGVWAYFRKKSSDGPFEIYTDTASKVLYLNRILSLFIFLFLINLLAGISNLILSRNGSDYGLISSTIGLWGVAVAFIILIPTIKVYRRKKELKEQQNLFD